MTDSVERRRQRLAEAVAWCALQKLQNNPLESDEVKRRRALGERAANHAFAAHQLEAASPFKWVTRGKVRKMKDEASEMLAEANLDAIRPLADQLRSVALKPDRQLSDAKASDEERAAMVESLCETRARLLRESGSYPTQRLPPPWMARFCDMRLRRVARIALPVMNRKAFSMRTCVRPGTHG